MPINTATWYSDWFDSPYYHLLYRHRDEQEARLLIDSLLRYLKPQPCAAVLDLACGKGRHALYMNRQGLAVAGIDLSPASIAYARQLENKLLSFFVHDMRQVFRANAFDYVFNLFTSFGYFDDGHTPRQSGLDGQPVPK